MQSFFYEGSVSTEIKRKEYWNR